MSEKKKYYTLSVKISKELLHKFNTEIVHKYGRIYGNMPKIVSEAIKLWVDAQKKEREEKEK